MSNKLLQAAAEKSLRTEPLGEFRIGDTVDVHTRIKEGDKERIQIFNGTVIAQNRGHNAVDGSFVVRRVVAGEGVERTFPVHSPKVVKVEVTRRGRVRRAKLFYLRDRVGKATKVKDELVKDETGASVKAAKG